MICTYRNNVFRYFDSLQPLGHVVASMKMTLISLTIWMLGPQLVTFLGRIRRWALLGESVSLGSYVWGFKSQCHSHCLSLPFSLSWWIAGCKLSTITQHHVCLPAIMLPTMMDKNFTPLKLWANPKLNSFLDKLYWSWCFVMVMES